ncbi:MAG: hypothetical protein QXD82_02740, partial [Nitrososphaerales archaeon]
DACITQNVRTFTNKTFATYKKSVGRFVSIAKDHRYHEPHLIMSNEITDEEIHDITSIPLGIIMKINVINEKMDQITVKYAKSSIIVPLQVIKLKRAQRLEHLEDGGIKIVLEKDVKEDSKT